MWLITCRLASAHAGLSVRVWDARVSMWMRACLQTPSLPKRASMAGWCIRWHVNYSAFKRGLSWVEVSRGLMAVRWSGEAACREKVQRWGAHVEIYMCIPPGSHRWVSACTGERWGYHNEKTDVKNCHSFSPCYVVSFGNWIEWWQFQKCMQYSLCWHIWRVKWQLFTHLNISNCYL